MKSTRLEDVARSTRELSSVISRARDTADVLARRAYRLANEVEDNAYLFGRAVKESDEEMYLKALDDYQILLQEWRNAVESGFMSPRNLNM